MALALVFHGRGSLSGTALCFSAMDRMLGFRVRERMAGGLAAFNAASCSREIFGRNLWETFMSTSRAIQPLAFISLATLLIITSDYSFSTCHDRGMVRTLALDFSMKNQGCSVLSGSGRIFADPLPALKNGDICVGPPLVPHRWQPELMGWKIVGVRKSLMALSSNLSVVIRVFLRPPLDVGDGVALVIADFIFSRMELGSKRGSTLGISVSRAHTYTSGALNTRQVLLPSPGCACTSSAKTARVCASEPYRSPQVSYGSWDRRSHRNHRSCP